MHVSPSASTLDGGERSASGYVQIFCGKNGPLYPLRSSLSEAQSRFGSGDKKKNPFPFQESDLGHQPSNNHFTELPKLISLAKCLDKSKPMFKQLADHSGRAI
jgi:hypothetical protein